MKFDRQLRPATETSWVVSYGGKTIPKWRTAAILKIDISPYLGEKSSDFHEILYTAADFELDERHVALVPNEKVALNWLRVRQNLFLVSYVDFQRHEAEPRQVSATVDCELKSNRHTLYYDYSYFWQQDGGYMIVVCHSVNRITDERGNGRRPNLAGMGKGWPSRSDQLLVVIQVCV